MKRDLDRFWSKVKVNSIYDCWEWQAAKIRGYGLFEYKGKSRRAHRVSWEITYGDIPKGMYVLHKCDNPACVNPNHLFLGTQEDNMRDMIQKGRKVKPSKLSDADVIGIRARYATGTETLAGLGREFGLTKQAIWRTIKYKNWKDLKQSYD